MWTSGSWAAALGGEGPALLLGLAAWLPLRALGKRCGLLPCSFAACLSLWEDRRERYPYNIQASEHTELGLSAFSQMDC